jgi:hypothetical protein
MSFLRVRAETHTQGVSLTEGEGVSLTEGEGENIHTGYHTEGEGEDTDRVSLSLRVRKK